ncbi:PREDICTED: uncharacterized protein LOC106100338 [Papilio polytes]|uniref:uncharacterized protein LOC106100338 n=1 Tax=Papilio polytes TaxID=76194 RepID=UPI0006767292|nr:PREDICTED: uncharacterized protein LOC106100338 [Papilio polytes]
MSNATVRNFCTYQCAMTFQGQYSEHPPLVSEETLEQSKAIPIGAPRQIYPSDKNDAKNVQRNSSPLPVISNVQSLPPPQLVLIPTTRKSAEGIMKEMNKIHDKIQTDPLETEMPMIAGMVAGDKKSDHIDLDTDDDNG